MQLVDLKSPESKKVSDQPSIMNPQDLEFDCLQKIESITQNHFHQTEKSVADLKKILSEVSSDLKYTENKIKGDKVTPVVLQRYKE